MKIKTVLILSLIFFSLSSMIAYSVFYSVSIANTAKAQAEITYSSIVDSGKDNVGAYTQSIEATAKSAAINTAVAQIRANDNESITNATEALNLLVGTEAGISRVIILDGAQVIATTDPAYNDEIDFETLDLMQNEKAGIVAPLSNTSTSTSGVYEALVPLQLGDYRMLVYFDKSDLDRILLACKFSTNGKLAFVDPYGHIIDEKYMENLDKTNSTDYVEIKNLINSGGVQLDKSTYFGQRVTMVSRMDNGWYVCALADQNRAYYHSDIAVSTVVDLVVILSFIFVALYIVIIFMITKPLAEIEKTLVKIHRGDHDSRIEVIGRNEYGDISRAFNDLIDQIIVSERRYRTIFEMSDDIIFEWNLKSNNITFSNNFNKKFSYRAPSDNFSDSFFLKGKVHPEDNERYRRDLEALSKGEAFKNNQYRWKNIYGDYIWISVRTETIRDKDNNTAKIIGVLSDIDRAKKQQTRLIERASYDALTGVYNRETIENVINNEIEKITESSEGFAVLFIDIDDFKIYNDKYSHATGDQVLKFTASTVQSLVSEYGFVGRYGGDEFVVCVRNSSTNSPSRVAQDIMAKLKEGFVGDNDVNLSVSVSIGIYNVSDNSRHVEDLIASADNAMYRIKKNGKSNFGFLTT